jgi:hypothetical protein
MRDAKGFVEIEVADVSAEMSGSSHANEGIEIGPIEIHLTTGIVNCSADFPDCFFENPMGGWVRDHECGEGFAVLLDFRAQIVDVDVPVVIAGDDNDAHPNHGGTGSIGSMCRSRYEADRSVGVAISKMPRTNCEQASEFAL